MTSLFDSNVRERRNSTPWAVMSLPAFMRDMMFHGKVTFSCEYRPDVASRQWFTIEWTSQDGHTYRAEAQEWDLCLWRAAQRELQIHEKLKREEQDNQP